MGDGRIQSLGRRSVLAVVALLSLGGEALGQSGASSHPPTDILRRYVALDQRGARLDAASFETLAPYIDWRQEPAWGRVVVVQDATIPEDYRQWQIIDKLEVIIPVTFRVLGSVYLETGVFVPEDTEEEVRFRVRVLKAKWRIIEPVIPPHVGLKRMINFVREAQLQETDETRRSTLIALEAALKKAKP